MLEQMPKFDPPPLDPGQLQTEEGRREWLSAFCAEAARADFRRELERRQREARLREHPIIRAAMRVFGPVLVDPLDVMFGPKEKQPHGR